VNLALHLINALLLWYLLNVLRVPGAWLCAIIFAVHPVNVEAIAWILQRKTLLSTTLAFASLACCIRPNSEHPRVAYGLAIVLFCLAMLTKSAVVLWPATMLLARWWQCGRLQLADIKWSAPFWAVSLVLGCVGVWFQRFRAMADDTVRADDLVSRFAIAGKAIWFYAYKAVFPKDLCFIYPRWQLGVSSVLSVVPLLLLIVVGIVCWKYRHRWGRGVLAAGGYYVLNLFPALGFVNIYFMRFSLVADHWQYLALPGIVTLIVSGAIRFASTYNMRLAANAVSCAVVLLLVLLANRHAVVFSGKTNEPLWQATLECNPRAWIAHNDLAVLLLANGDQSGAELHARQAIELNPKYPEAESTLGNIAIAKGNLDDALEHFRRAIEYNPDYLAAYLGMGIVLTFNGEDDAAARYLPTALGRPDLQPEWHIKLARLYISSGQHEEAIQQFRHAVDLVSVLPPDIHLDFASTLVQTGDAEAAIKEYHLLLSATPDSKEALNNLAWILATHPQAQLRDPPKAIALASRLTEMIPAPRYWDTLGAAYAAAHRFNDAIEAADQALQRLPQADTGLRSEIERRLDLYREGKVYVDDGIRTTSAISPP